VIQSNLKGKTIDQLLDRFIELCVAQDGALLKEDYALYNRLYCQMNGVDSELRSRGRLARLALLRLFEHPHVQVRLKAATRALAVAPVQARMVLEDIVASQEFPQAGEAGMTIGGLDDGTFKPT
jgi:Domain of unknown function (DUF2019)